MSRPIVITGGGTGGHIFPMQAIAEQLHAAGVPLGAIRFVGSRRGQEGQILSDTGIALTLLPGRGISRSLSPRSLVRNLGAAISLVMGFALAFFKVGIWRPRVVVSVGGYASFAVAMSAVIWRRPLIVVELDATPGAVHRVVGRFAIKHCVAFGSGETNEVVTGAPIRNALQKLDRSVVARSRARAEMSPPIESHRRVLVVMTGSLGARSVNDAVLDLARLWSDRDDLTILHVTGRRNYDNVSAKVPTTQQLDYRIMPFGDMVQLWSVADIALCRAGATTVAELTALGIASILVPLPNAPGDHQYKNAVAVEKAGGALVLQDDKCTGATLAHSLDVILADNVANQMGENAHRLGHLDAASAIAKVILEVG